MIEVRRVEPGELPEAIDFVIAQNADPARHVAYYGADAAEIRPYIEGLTPPPLQGMFVARESGRLVGVLTLEYEVALARAWIHGPQVDPPTRVDVAAKLYATAAAALPADITMHELYLDSGNEAGAAFARAHGFSLYKDVGILAFPRDALPGLPASEPLTPLRAVDHAAVIALHEQLFPNSYCPGTELVKKTAEHEPVLTAHHEGRLAGYIHLRRDVPGRLAHIEFLGVVEAFRGLGLGGALLRSALRWGFEHPAVASVSLVVEDGNTLAYDIYLRTGFVLERQSRAFRRTLD